MEELNIQLKAPFAIIRSADLGRRVHRGGRTNPNGRNAGCVFAKLAAHGCAALANITRRCFTSEAKLFDQRGFKNIADFFSFPDVDSSRAGCQERCRKKRSGEWERPDDRGRNVAITLRIKALFD